MSDITMMKGYGFPRGSGMDYAGYGAYGRRFAAVQSSRESSIFSKIPALDGLGEGDFGTEYTFTRQRAALGDMTLPTLDVETGEWTPATQPMSGAGKGLAVGLGLLGLYLLFK